MNRVAYYVQPCPTCGRRIQVRVQYLGRPVNCEHCTATFTAESPPSAVNLSDSAVLRRVDALLASADALRRQSAEDGPLVTDR